MEDLRVAAFFTPEEMQGFFQTMMWKAQEELYTTLQRENETGVPFNKDLFFKQLEKNRKLAEVMRGTVLAAIQNANWKECLHIAMAAAAKPEA